MIGHVKSEDDTAPPLANLSWTEAALTKLREHLPESQGTDLFSGMNGLRQYATMMEAAKKFTEELSMMIGRGSRRQISVPPPFSSTPSHPSWVMWNLTKSYPTPPSCMRCQVWVTGIRRLSDSRSDGWEIRSPNLVGQSMRACKPSSPPSAELHGAGNWRRS